MGCAYLQGLSQVAIPGILRYRLVWSASDEWSGGNKALLNWVIVPNKGDRVWKICDTNVGTGGVGEKVVGSHGCVFLWPAGPFPIVR